MAEDPTITEKVKVHLKTRLSVEGAVKWAHPVTELRCIVSASSGGGIVLSGNSLSFDRSVLQLPTSAEVPTIGSNYFCPLQLIVSGATQYADMYVEGATATVHEVPNSTGYGEFTHPIDVVQAVRGTSEASSMSVPSELAVANALEHKQRLLSAGSFVSFTSGNVADVIAVNGAVTVRPAGQADNTVLPTEGAVRAAIVDASTACSAYALQLTTTLGASVSAAGYATSTWVDTNYAKKSDIPDPGAVYTFTSGLSETDTTNHVVELLKAKTNVIGGVMIPTGSGLTLNTTTGELKLSPASTTAIGGVQVPNNSGLVLNTTTGQLTLNTAQSYANYNAAAAGQIGGVRVVKQIDSSNDTAQLNSGYVPSVQAVWDWVSGATGGMQTWVQNNYVSTGGGVAVNWGTATANSLGVVKVPTENGLSVTNGAIALSPARYVDGGDEPSTPLGGIRVLVGHGLALGTTAGATGEYAAGNLWMVDAAIGETIGGVYLRSTIATHDTGTTDDYYNDNHLPTEKAIATFVENAVAGAAAAYAGDFAVTGTSTAGTYAVAAGAVYLDDRQSVYKTFGGGTCSLPSGSTAGELWVVIDSNSVSITGGSPTFNSIATSFPLAYVNGSKISQHQLGPIVVRGRWS